MSEKKQFTRDASLYVKDISNSISRIENYVGNLDFDSFKSNDLIVDGVVRNFMVLGI